MSLKNIPLAKKDFEELPLKELIKKCDMKECDRYFPLFFDKVHEAEEAGEAKTEEVFTLLGYATSMMLKPSSPTEPFTPLFVMHDSRSAIIDDFSEDHFKFFGEIVFDILDPEIRARIADILWVKKRDFRAAELAITAYLDSATILEDPIQWTKCADRIERAVRLAASLGRNTGHLDKVISHIETVLDKYNGEDPLFLSEKLMGLLLEFRQGDSTNIQHFQKSWQNVPSQMVTGTVLEPIGKQRLVGTNWQRMPTMKGLREYRQQKRMLRMQKQQSTENRLAMRLRLLINNMLSNLTDESVGRASV